MKETLEGLERAMDTICLERASERSHDDGFHSASLDEQERLQRLAELKATVQAGMYKPDIKELARHLASYMEPQF